MKVARDLNDASQSDEILVVAVVNGDEESFRTLYRRHSPRLGALTGRMLGWHEADTEDALQETWVRAVARFSTFSRESSLLTWLSGIAINVSWELMRQRRRAAFSETLEGDVAPNRNSIERMDLEQALARLPDAQRIVVVLHDVEGYKHDEIAHRLSIAEGTSKSHLFRARRTLRVLLESYERIPK